VHYVRACRDLFNVVALLNSELTDAPSPFANPANQPQLLAVDLFTNMGFEVVEQLSAGALAMRGTALRAEVFTLRTDDVGNYKVDLGGRS
jgi:hypothetical protein